MEPSIGRPEARCTLRGDRCAQSAGLLRMNGAMRQDEK